MKYKAIISDIDGTLTPLAWHSKINKRITSAINKVQEKGIYFCLATGKPFYLIEHLIDELSLTSPVIVDNGASIYSADTKEMLWEAPMAFEEVKKVLELCKNYNYRTRITEGKIGFDIEGDLPDSSHYKKIVLMSMKHQDAEKLTKKVEDIFKDLTVTRAQAHDGDKFTDLYITNIHATKQHAIVKLSEILKIPTEEMIGIGDHYNDFPLLMACGLKVAMGNAVPELKAIADYIAPDVDHDGVADFIEKFVLNS